MARVIVNQLPDQRMKTAIKSLRGALAALAVPLALGACNRMLDVSNPSIIQSTQVGDVSMVPILANGIEAQFQRTFANQALYMGVLSDELMDGHVYLPQHEWDSRDLYPTEEFVESQFALVHALRGAADTLGARMHTLLGDSAGSSVNMAKAWAYGGYAYLFLGENFCGSPINGSATLTDKQLLDLAIQHFDSAIAVASAAKARSAANADAFLNLARVGAARAALDENDRTRAVQYAQQVPADFVFWAEYSANSAPQNNLLWDPMQNYDPARGDVRWIALDPPFQNLNDLRIPQTDVPLSLMDTRAGYVPYQPSSFSGWKADGSKVPFTKGDAIRVASGLEAQYLLQEIQGPTLDFLNQRRAVGGEAPLASMPTDPQAELRDQRRRDLFLDSHRFADMRRYKAQYGIDLFQEQTGPYPGIANMVYHDKECVPVSQVEIDNNKNAKQP